MTNYLLDTNVLLCMSDSTSSMNLFAGEATATLLNQRDRIFIASQTVIDFWVVASRPLTVNGLGQSVDSIRAEVEPILNPFERLKDIPTLFQNWLSLVTTDQIQGKRVHAARLIAVMLAHRVAHLLTFNSDDFSQIREIKVLHPQSISPPNNP